MPHDMTLPDADTLDFSMLDEGDLVNIVLQRSAVLGLNKPAFGMVRSWERGDPAPLRAEVRARGADLARTAARHIADEFAGLRAELAARAPRRLADIGCGYALFDLYAWRAFGCDLLLIDIESSEARHFGYHHEGAGYSSLATATELLVANGVPRDRIATWNPNRGPLPPGPPLDLAVSFLSCGFHYPVDGYLPFFRDRLADDGAAILDLRRRKADAIAAQLAQIGQVRVLSEAAKVRRVIVEKGALR